MALPTRLDPFRTPSPEPLAGKEATTQKKCKFFDALSRDRRTKPGLSDFSLLQDLRVLWPEIEETMAEYGFRSKEESSAEV